jgi:hypothetical protein
LWIIQGLLCVFFYYAWLWEDKWPQRKTRFIPILSIKQFINPPNQQSEKGNKTAGTRARKSALELSKMFKDFRKVSVEESKK